MLTPELKRFAIAFTLMALIPLLATFDALRLRRSAGDGLRRVELGLASAGG